MSSKPTPTPLFARVILRRPIVKKTAGGIILPEASAKKDANAIGIVLAVGPTADKSIEVGQTVTFGIYGGSWMQLPGYDEELFICQDEDILAIL